MKASSQPIRATRHTPTPSLRQSMEVVDPDQNAADRLHVVTIAAVTLTVWVIAESVSRKAWLGLIAIPATFCIGVSCGLPLYLFLRSR